MFQILLKRGDFHRLKPTTLAYGEIAYMTDTRELYVGTDEGPVPVANVNIGPEGALYNRCTDGRMIPLCVKINR